MRETRFGPSWLRRVGLCALAVLVLFPSGVLATRPALPPRPTPVAPVVTPPARSEAVFGAFIELQGQTAAVGQSAVVQWQDAQGEWHDVDGWRAQLTTETVRWWVDPKDFGTGPFRWLVYEENGDAPPCASAAFQLPNAAYGLRVVTVDVE